MEHVLWRVRVQMLLTNRYFQHFFNHDKNYKYYHLFLFWSQNSGRSFLSNKNHTVFMTYFLNSCNCCVYITNTAFIIIQSLGITRQVKPKQMFIIIEYHDFLLIIKLLFGIFFNLKVCVTHKVNSDIEQLCAFLLLFFTSLS